MFIIAKGIVVSEEVLDPIDTIVRDKIVDVAGFSDDDFHFCSSLGSYPLLKIIGRFG